MSHKIGITACSNPMHPSFSADLARLCQILRELGFDPVLSPASTTTVPAFPARAQSGRMR